MSQELIDFCTMTGRKPSSNKFHAGLLQLVYNEIVPLTGLDNYVIPTILVDDGSLQTFYADSPVNGIVLDEGYLASFAGLFRTIVAGENPIEVATPLVRAIASILEYEGRPVEALMLRHERVSGLYALDSSARQIRVMMDCDVLLERLELIAGIGSTRMTELCLAYLVMHEYGHWLYNEHSQEGSLASVVEEIRNHVGDLLAEGPSDNMRVLAKEAGINVDLYGSNMPANLVEETFCDQFTAGAMYAYAAKTGMEWQTCFVMLACMHEANRLHIRAREIAFDFTGAQAFLARKPSFGSAIVQRSMSSANVRSHFASTGLRGYVPTIFREYGGVELENATIVSQGNDLSSQALRYLTYLAGPLSEKTIYLLLRSVESKRHDTEVHGFFRNLAERFEITDSVTERAAFERIVADETRDFLSF
ncbi:MAG: hypothetical protein AAF249_09460 [Pseudomonadota bacterium]